MNTLCGRRIRLQQPSGRLILDVRFKGETGYSAKRLSNNVALAPTAVFIPPSEVNPKRDHLESKGNLRRGQCSILSAYDDA